MFPKLVHFLYLFDRLQETDLRAPPEVRQTLRHEDLGGLDVLSVHARQSGGCALIENQRQSG